MTSAEVIAAVAETDEAVRRCYYSYLYQMALQSPGGALREGALEFAYLQAVDTYRTWRNSKIEGQIGHGRDQPEAVGLVWRKVSPWVQETFCGRYRIEKFATGLDVLTEGYYRYKVLKCIPEWCHEFAPSESNAEAAKQICQQDLTRG